MTPARTQARVEGERSATSSERGTEKSQLLTHGKSLG